LTYFEDLVLGSEWTTRGKTVTEADLTAFAGVSGDFGPLQLDAEHARGSLFESRVAHGAHLISLAFGLGSMDLPMPATVALVGTGWRFVRPVRLGETVRARWRLGRKRDVEDPRWGLAVWQVSLLNSQQEPAAEGEVTLLVQRGQAPQAAAGRRRRRRRGGQVAQVAQTVEANLPEPAPVDTPPPSRRRRRGPRQPAAEPDVQPVAEEPASGPAPAPSGRRRRRRRSGGGNGGQPATEPAPQASAPAAPAVTSGDENPIGRVLNRLRRSRPRVQ